MSPYDSWLTYLIPVTPNLASCGPYKGVVTHPRHWYRPRGCPWHVPHDWVLIWAAADADAAYEALCRQFEPHDPRPIAGREIIRVCTIPDPFEGVTL
jgi:hypothetical protein